MALELILRIQTQAAQPSAVGVDQYDGGEAFEVTNNTSNNRLAATFMSTTQTVSNVTNAHGLDTGMFDLALFFVTAAHPHGGGGGTPPPGVRPQLVENIRLQGAVDFVGRQQPTPNNPKDIELVIGSVSAASTAWQSLIGHEFRLERMAQGQGQGQQQAWRLRIA